MEEEKYRMCLFDGLNFGSWKFRLEAILDQYDLKTFLENDLDTLCVGKTPDIVTALTKKEKRCKAIIINHIADDQLEYIKDKTSPKEIFDTLKSVFERKTISSQLFIRKKLLILKYIESDEMNQYLLKFDKIIRQLKESGAHVEESDIICYLLLSLPKSYDAVVAALETMDQTKLTVEFVKARLLDEHNKRQNHSTSGSRQQSTAFYTQKQGFSFKCHNCGKPGHKRSNCRSKSTYNRDNQSGHSGQSHQLSYGNHSSQWNHQPSSQFYPKNQNRQSGSKQYSQSNLCEAEDEELCFIVGNKFDKNDTRNIRWLLDSGATEHMTNSEDYFYELETLREPISIAVAKKNQSVIATKRGNIRILYNNTTINIKGVLFVPNLKFNLLSVGKLQEKGFTIIFKEDKAIISKGNKTFLEILRNKKLYDINLPYLNNENCGNAASTKDSSLMLWHRRFGHVNKASLLNLCDKNIVEGLPKFSNTELSFCEPCVIGKQCRFPYTPVKNPRSRRPLELIHSDVCGPLNPETFDKKKYFCTFIDDFTHFVMVFLLTNKNEVFECFKQYKEAAEVHFKLKISRLRVDNGGEYSSNDFKSFCCQNGIQLEYTIPYTPQQNGVSERFNRSLVEKARSMIADSGLPKNLWGEAVKTAAYIMNRIPSNSLHCEKGITPAELWFCVKPDVTKFRVFGSQAYSHIPENKRTKLDDKSEKLIFVGYAKNGYRLWNPLSKEIIVSRNVIFNENDMSKGCTKFSYLYSEEVEENEDGEEELAQQKEEVRNKRVIKKPLWQKDFVTDFENENEEESYLAYALNAESFTDPEIPENIYQLEGHPEKQKWEEAIQEELRALHKNNTWTLSELPSDRKAINCKWVFTVKRGESGNIIQYRARLVAKGCSQTKGLDFNETYSPVSRLTTLRILLSVANEKQYYIHQMDFKSAFLNGTLNETIYMKQPPGYEIGEKVCKLNKTIYGLKQSSREWYKSLSNLLLQEHFEISEADKCVFVKLCPKGTMYVIVYVDDLLLIADDEHEMGRLKESLSKVFSMKDLGEVRHFLGLQIERNIQTGVMKLSQTHFIERLLAKFKMTECKPKSVPVEQNLKLKLCESVKPDNKPYRELVGCLMYLAMTTRADICYAVSFFSRFQSNPSDECWTHLKQILRYLKKTKDLKLVFKSNRDPVLVTFCDSDWASDINSRKSITGFLIKIFGNSVIWGSRKQNCVALSTCEAEYIALSTAISETLWVQKLLNSIGFNKNDFSPSKIFEDNQSVIFIAGENKSDGRLKHIDVRLSFVQDIIQKKIVELIYIESRNQEADLFTKGLSNVQFNKFVHLLGYA